MRLTIRGCIEFFVCVGRLTDEAVSYIQAAEKTKAKAEGFGFVIGDAGISGSEKL